MSQERLPVSFQFEWDEDKAEANLHKHGISFEEAITVFGDALAVTIHNGQHSTFEDRFVDIGRSIGGRVLVVVYTKREGAIRIISCRRATSAERRQYEQEEFGTTD